MSSHSLASNLLLNSARDIYGRFLGQVVGISYDTMGDLTAIQVEHGGESLAEYPISQVSINKNFVVLIPKWKVDTDIIQKEWRMIQKKIFALDNLLKSGKVSKTVYQRLIKQEFEPLIRKLRKEREGVMSDIKCRYDELALKIGKFESSIANIELERMVGGMDDQTYKTCYQSIKPLLDSAVAERRDIKVVIERLNNLDRAY